MRGAKRRLAFLIHDLRAGGAERITVWLANGMVARGIEVDLVLVNQAGNPSYFASLDPAVRVTSLARSRTLTSLIGIRRYFDQARPDCVVSALTHINIAAVLGRLGARHKPRLVVVEHNQMSRNIRRKKGLVRMAYAAVPRLYRLADLIGAVSEGVKADLVALTGLGAGRIAVLHNPVVTPAMQAQSRLDPGHPWLGPGEPPVILGVGRLTEQKNFPMLIEAFAILRKTHEARLLILGQGRDREALEAQAGTTGYRDDIGFTGLVDNPFAYMRRARIFALSSHWEGLPTVLIEAMACGTQVVATDCPSGPAEILLNGKLAPLTPPGDAAAFAAALASTLDHPKPVEPLIARAEAFSLDAAVDRYLQVAFPDDHPATSAPLAATAA